MRRRGGDQALAEDYIARLTGKQTVYQIIELAKQVKSRGGQPLEPLAYKRCIMTA